jgi:hypothetical protein
MAGNLCCRPVLPAFFGHRRYPAERRAPGSAHRNKCHRHYSQQLQTEGAQMERGRVMAHSTEANLCRARVQVGALEHGAQTILKASTLGLSNQEHDWSAQLIGPSSGVTTDWRCIMRSQSSVPDLGGAHVPQPQESCISAGPAAPAAGGAPHAMSLHCPERLDSKVQEAVQHYMASQKRRCSASSGRCTSIYRAFGIVPGSNINAVDIDLDSASGTDSSSCRK